MAGPVEARLRPRPGLVAAAAAVAAAASLPVGYLVIRAGSAGTDDLLDTLIDPRLLTVLFRTVLLCAAVTSTAVAIALPMAWLTVRSDLPGRRLWVVASTLPLVIPSFVGGYAFVAALGPRGLLQGWLAPLGVERLPAFYGFPGAWLVLSLFTYPLALLPIRAAIASLDPSLEEAARALGRTRLSTMFRLTIPQLRPSILSGALLVALYTLSDFGAVSLLRFESFTFVIFRSYRTFDRTGAALLGLVLVGLALLVLIAESRSRGRAVHHATHRGTRRVAKVSRLGRWRWPAFAFCAVVVGVALLVPVGVTTIWFVRGVAAGVPLGPALHPAINSMYASLLGAAATLLCAWPVALLASRYRSRLSRVIETVSNLGFALPGLVIALALVFFGARYTPLLYQTVFMLIFAYVVHFLPQATGTLRTSIERIHPGVEEAARSLGAGPWEVRRRVTFPLVRRGALMAYALVFLTVMKELPATLLLAPAGFSTLATEVWDAASAASFGSAAMPAIMLVLLSSVPMALLVSRERNGPAPGSSGW